MGYMTSQYRKVVPARIEQRDVVRHNVQLQRATVRKHSKEPEEALLTEISAYGCRLTIDRKYKAGDRLWLRFNGGRPIAAAAVWYEDGRLGCKFDDALDRETLRSLTIAAH